MQKPIDTINELTRPEALAILGIVGSYTKHDIKTAFRRLSSKYHPDKVGGDTEKMKDINTAYDMLKGTSGVASFKTHHNTRSADPNAPKTAADVKAERDRQKKAADKAVDRLFAEIETKFQPLAFLSYFESIFNQRFTIKTTKRNSAFSSFNIAAYFENRFETEDGKIAFDFDLYIRLHDVENIKASLSNNPDLSYDIGVTAFGYSNRKKQKMSARDWKHTNDHSLFSDPTKTFPKAKLNKMLKEMGTLTKMKRSDFELSLKKEVKAEYLAKDYYEIEVKDGFVRVGRSVLMRTPFWSVEDIGTKEGLKFITIKELMRNRTFFPENTETVDTFIEIRKMTMAKAHEYLLKQHRKFMEREK